ncbi:hypothetical protein, variant [Verruconis gallopava]|nr:hypothetical protein, variant [Verruconis gallopava]KIW07943.1 hypothetical protein, variant [Verruconis gallopava]
MDRSREVAGTATAITVQKPSLPSMSVLGHRPQEEPRQNDLPAVRTVPSQPLQPKPVVTERVVHLPQQQQPNPTDRGSSPANAHLNGQTLANPSTGTTHYSPSVSAKLDPLDRLQAQMSINRSTLESCTRDIARLEGAFQQLRSEFQETVEVVRRELLAARQHIAAAAHPERLDDQTLEIFSTTLSQAVSKANEVDVLRVQFEVVKRRLQRLEESNTSPTSAANPDYLLHARQQPVHHVPVAHHGPQTQMPQVRTSEPPRVLPSHPPQPATYVSDQSHRPQYAEQEKAVASAAATPPSWISINTGLKRGPPGAADGHGDAANTPIGSPKRAKLAPLEPRYAYEAQAGSTPAARYERMDTDESITTPQNYRNASHDSYPDTTNPSTLAPSSTQEGGSEDIWHTSYQRTLSGVGHSISPRGRGRGRGRGGRPRKSMPLEPHISGTPESEKEGWAGSQAESDGFYRGGASRQSSGSGPTMAPSPVQNFDPYSHTKRSRTKPVRNADGILIRKDGRPDMRSQSSAANLRKVHAKKEEEKREAAAGVSASGRAGDASAAAESPASTASHDVEAGNTQERADHILKHMFPKGVEQERARLDTAQRYFPSDHSQTGTGASTPVDRAATESEHADSVEPEKSRDDTPQQQDETKEDGSPNAVDVAKSTVAESVAPAPSAESQRADEIAPTSTTQST